MAEDIRHITDDSEYYPPLLREIAKAPDSLYVRGNVSVLAHERLFAVVGSRKASPGGRRALRHVVQPVVAAGVPLISGLAFGIDSLAHKLCLDHNTPTVAVLGGGVDDASMYPRRHISLAHQIIESGGAVISEYTPGTPALPHHFLARNRIIAGLAIATLVVQAADRSGSLSTARLALEANRDVMAIPGDVTDPLAIGTNRLIQQGAEPALSGADLLAYFQLAPGAAVAAIDLSPNQQLVAQHLSTTPHHIDELADKTGLSAAALATELTQLELKGVTENVGGAKYVRTT